MNVVDISVKKTKEQKIYLYYGSKMKVAGVLFLIGILLGGILVWYTVNGVDSTELIQIFKEEDVIIGKPTFTSIFMNNVIVAMIMCGGIFVGRILTQIVIFINGVMVGVVLSSYLYTDISSYMLLSLLPHAMFEIPLLLFCASFGMNKYKGYSMKEYCGLILFVVIGFAVAALIEVNLSYKIALHFQ